ncbi:MAG: YhfC family intramembrane metalloprotease [Lachnospiraceae bacterium]|nr:YhfC family intramembrane metalloprotease [Lachnospiraceae bacterium]
MSELINSSVMTGLIIYCLIGVFVPIYLYIFFWRRTDCGVKPFWIGVLGSWVINLIVGVVTRALLGDVINTDATLVSTPVTTILLAILTTGGLVACFWIFIKQFMKKELGKKDAGLYMSAGAASYLVFGQSMSILFVLYVARMFTGWLGSYYFEAMGEDGQQMVLSFMHLLDANTPIDIGIMIIDSLATAAMVGALALLVWFGHRDRAKYPYIWIGAGFYAVIFLMQRVYSNAEPNVISRVISILVLIPVILCCGYARKTWNVEKDEVSEEAKE